MYLQEILRDIFGPSCSGCDMPLNIDPFCRKCGLPNRQFDKQRYLAETGGEIEEALRDCQDNHKNILAELRGDENAELRRKYPYCGGCGAKIFNDEPN